MAKIKKKEKTQKNLATDKISQLASSMQLPMGLLPDLTHFQVNGNREVIIEGCRGVLQYEHDFVKVNTGKTITIFKGRNLILKCFTADSLVIEGFITSIEFTM